MFFPTFQLVPGLGLALFLCGWGLDRLFGDPERWPHPIVWFGNVISLGEQYLNHGANRKMKGGLLSLGLSLSVFMLVSGMQYFLLKIHLVCYSVFIVWGVFNCLSGKTLEREVCLVFKVLDRSLEEGRIQVGRIVGRDTQHLSPQEIRLAALETLSENLSDGVIAPMFWFALLGLPGMMAYKMINTLDSMIGYKNDRYGEFGKIAALTDDVANFIPARITAVLMLLVKGRWDRWRFVRIFGKAHASPNSGYPEAALAAILDCRFGGTHDYSGKPVVKPYIGITDRIITSSDLQTAVEVNRRTEMVAGLFLCCILVV